jgi:hypothetical protein
VSNAQSSQACTGPIAPVRCSTNVADSCPFVCYHSSRASRTNTMVSCNVQLLRLGGLTLSIHFPFVGVPAQTKQARRLKRA